MLRTDTRAQSIQIGAVLLFGVLIVLLSTWQAFGIPNQNEGVEFNHNQEVQQQMTELRTTANSMPDASVPRSVTLDLGVRYPSRTIFRNPPPPAGTVRTVDTGEEAYAINITGSPVDENLAQLWNKTGSQYNTGAIKYSPQYNQYQNPPQTIYEHSVVYNKFESEDTTLSISGQSIIEADRISLIFLNGSLSESRVDSTSIDFEPISTQTRTVQIEPEIGEALKLDIPTRMELSEWESLLDERHEVIPLSEVNGEEDPFISNDEIQTIRIEVDANRNNGPRDRYKLKLAKIGIGTGTTETDAEYLTKVSGDAETITEGESQRFILEARDEYNRPISSENITATVTNTGDFSGGTLINITDSDRKQPERAFFNSTNTNSEGQVAFEFQADGMDIEGKQDIQLEFQIANKSGADAATVDMTLTVEERTEATVNDPRYEVSSTDTTIVPGLTGTSAENCQQLPCNVTLEASTAPKQIGAPVGFGSENNAITRAYERLNVTDGSGTARTTVRFKPNRGNTTLWSQSGGASDSVIVSTPLAAGFENSLSGDNFGVFGTFRGDDSDKLSSQNANTGTNSAIIDGGDNGGIITTGYNTTGGESVVVQYWVRNNDIGGTDDPNGDLQVEYLDNTGRWIVADSVPQDDTTVDSSEIRTIRLGRAAMHSNFSIRFRQINADNANDEWLIDDPTITVLGEKVGPGEPGGRSPGSGSDDSDTYLEADDGSANTEPAAIDLEEGGNYDGIYEAAKIGIVNTKNKQIDRVNSITVELPDASGNIQRLDAPSRDRDSYAAEVYFAGNNNDGYIDLPSNSISLGDMESFSGNNRQVGDIDSGSGVVLKLSQFRKSGGGPSGQDADMTGRTVELTLNFEANGETYNETVTVTLSNTEQN